MFGRSTKILINGEVLPLTKELLEKIKEQNEHFSERALRVLAFAYQAAGGKQRHSISMWSTI